MRRSRWVVVFGLALVAVAGFLLWSSTVGGASTLRNAVREPEATEAVQTLEAGLRAAAETDRLVFLHSSAPWCGWCGRLEAWLERDDIVPILSRDFVVVKIDVEETEGGQALMDLYTDGYKGVPVLVILDPDGAVLADSFTPDGRNIGSPQADWEIEHWNTMMRETARRITDADLEYMARTWAEDRG